MNVSDALRLMVRNYPGGRDVIALRLGKSSNTLEKELRADSGHKLGMADACEISLMCIEANSPHCRAFVNAVASTCGGFVELEVAEPLSTQDTREDMAGAVKECADALCVLTTALADERISDNECRQVERELADVVTKVQQVRQGIRSINAASKPAHVRAAA